MTTKINLTFNIIWAKMLSSWLVHLCFIENPKDLKKNIHIILVHPSAISCKQDLGQDTRYRNVSRSWKFRYKIIMVSCTKILAWILDTDITRSLVQTRKILGSNSRYLETNIPFIVTFSYWCFTLKLKYFLNTFHFKIQILKTLMDHIRRSSQSAVGPMSTRSFHGSPLSIVDRVRQLRPKLIHNEEII